MPHVGVDAITVGAELVLALQTIVSRKLAPGAGAVVSVTEFLTDGQRNVLPGQVVLKGDVRARLPEDRKAIAAFMRQIAGAWAQPMASAWICSSTRNLSKPSTPKPQHKRFTARGRPLDVRSFARALR